MFIFLDFRSEFVFRLQISIEYVRGPSRLRRDGSVYVLWSLALGFYIHLWKVVLSSPQQKGEAYIEFYTNIVARNHIYWVQAIIRAAGRRLSSRRYTV